MENTKDLVRAERSSRFVCQVGGGRLQLPGPRNPAAPGPPARGPVSSSHAPSISRAPLPLLAVKRSRGSPPPSTSDLGVLSTLLGGEKKKRERRKFFSAPPQPRSG